MGFKRAFATVVDSNVTALIATMLLFYFGSGPVRGFAITMGLGIAISMFTAVSIVRAVMAIIVKRWRLSVLRIEPLFGFKLVPEGPPSASWTRAYAGIAFSVFPLRPPPPPPPLASIALLVKPGLNYGVDFRGGLQMEVATSTPLSTLRSNLETLQLGEISLQEFGGASRVLVRAERQPGGEEAQTVAMQKMRGAIQKLDAGAKIERVEVVGPKVSGELAMPALSRSSSPAWRC